MNAKTILLMLLLAALPTGASATEAGWALLRNGGQVVLLAHANAPGRGDPANFDVEDCGTQRNLSDRGRQQAKRIGALFAARAEPVDHVLSSRWCRAIDTAELAFPRIEVEQIDMLDPPQADEASRAESAAAITALVADYTGRGNLVLVTHPDTVELFTGSRPREGEAVIVDAEQDRLVIHGRIVFN